MGFGLRIWYRSPLELRRGHNPRRVEPKPNAQRLLRDFANRSYWAIMAKAAGIAVQSWKLAVGAVLQAPADSAKY
ncbi:MAG: hypothetical protein AAF282_02900 [Cyanobacteria bacterium P01_A01_bin.15]